MLNFIIKMSVNENSKEDETLSRWLNKNLQKQIVLSLISSFGNFKFWISLGYCCNWLSIPPPDENLPFCTSVQCKVKELYVCGSLLNFKLHNCDYSSVTKSQLAQLDSNSFSGKSSFFIPLCDILCHWHQVFEIQLPAKLLYVYLFYYKISLNFFISFGHTKPRGNCLNSFSTQ